MRGSGRMIRLMGRGCIYIWMGLSIVESGRKINSMGLGRKHGLMGLGMKGIMSMVSFWS